MILARINAFGTFVPVTSKNSGSGCIKYGRGRVGGGGGGREPLGGDYN